MAIGTVEGVRRRRSAGAALGVDADGVSTACVGCRAEWRGHEDDLAYLLNILEHDLQCRTFDQAPAIRLTLCATQDGRAVQLKQQPRNAPSVWPEVLASVATQELYDAIIARYAESPQLERLAA
jgi:hypothetical protein